MAALTKFQAFTEHLAEKVHNLGADQLAVALCASANAPNAATHTVLADLVQIAYTNLSTRNIVTASSAQTAGTYKLTLADLVLTAAGGSVAAFRYIVVYNTATVTPTGALIGFIDYGSDLTLLDTHSLTLDFDGAAGALTVG